MNEVPPTARALATRRRARRELEAHRAGSTSAAASLTELLIDDLAQMQSQFHGVVPITSSVDAQTPVGYFLARQEADVLVRGARETAKLAAPWGFIARQPVAALRRFLDDVGILAAAAAIENASSDAPTLRHTALLRPFGEERISRILTRRLSTNLDAALSEPERSLIRDLIDRLGRDRVGESLAVAVGRRIAAVDWHQLPLTEQEGFRRIADSAVAEMFAPLEPLPLQTDAVRSLLKLGSS